MLKETVEWCKPTRATKYSAMVDLYAKDEVVILAGETKIVNLGVKIVDGELFESFCLEIKDIATEKEYCKFKQSHFIELHPRSSLRVKGLIVGVGVIDLDYPDEFGLIVHNPVRIFKILSGEECFDSAKSYTINKGDKIAQCTLVEHKGYLMGVSSNTERDGGFGSTNKNK